MAQMCPACSHNNADQATVCIQCRQVLLKLLGQDTLLAHRYRLSKVLGCGGMGAVYLAHDQNVPGRQVALKENLSAAPQAQQQFHSEVSVMVGLRHAGLPSVTDSFTGPLHRQYLVMDYIEGETLEAVVSQRHPLPIAQVVDLGGQLLDVLHYLHSRSIIHRDIKPTNIRLTAEGKAVLVDFGISKVHVPGQRTQAWGKGVGTAGYAPLEQYGLNRAGTDARTDLYSLGAVLYFALTAQTPPTALELDRGLKPLTPPHKLRPDSPLALQRVIFKAMALAMDNRYQTAHEMRQALTTLGPDPLRPTVSAMAAIPPTPVIAMPLGQPGVAPAVHPLPATPPASWSPQSPPVPSRQSVPKRKATTKRSPFGACLQLGCTLALFSLLMVVVLGGGYLYWRDGKLPELSTFLPKTLTQLALPDFRQATPMPLPATATPLPVNKIQTTTHLAQSWSLHTRAKAKATKPVGRLAHDARWVSSARRFVGFRSRGQNLTS